MIRKRAWMRRGWLVILASMLVAMFAVNSFAADEVIVTPQEHRRGPEQTFLTYPEWFLVFSPAEYAVFVREHNPSDFPFLGHIGQFWQGYGAVYEATRNRYPMNWGYHVMIMVIGVSTTVEYGLRAGYETLIGRIAELTRTHGQTEEDRYASRVAQDYVDFIRVEPWYKFDFRSRLIGLWKDTSLWGPDAIRKWERKYALTTEYGVKAAYGWLIGVATKASYDEPVPVTAVILDRLPDGASAELPNMKLLRQDAGGTALVTLPRYQEFTNEAAVLAKLGAQFEEIAGNRGPILLSLIAPTAWAPPVPARDILFTQSIRTVPGKKRVVLAVQVDSLGALLRSINGQSLSIEHIYDY
ncbi:hypothetical protein [Rhodanobacter sp. C05]|uniref:hypothetical protein n=1 Tax=Rhodanobacter sp. C05 TaxID=1945855 RepID=UPI0009873010|nr:hypothetical protein [Rhodanobacter sp. C05]OOG43669.1 hypothetical protein B0E51_02475 [Rhodanobacter sp. C05]